MSRHSPHVSFYFSFSKLKELDDFLYFLFPDQGSGFCVTGKIEAGYIQTGEKTLAMPPNETCTVKGTHCVIAASLAWVADCFTGPTEHFFLS